MLRSYSLRDTAINLAIGQIREATAPTTAKVNDRALWTSQPGLIRTFQKDGTNGLNFKLYSAMNMVVDGTANESSMLTRTKPPTGKSRHRLGGFEPTRLSPQGQCQRSGL